jgi:hypothetical protein
MRPPASFRKTPDSRTLSDGYRKHTLQVYYDDDDRVEYVDLSSPGDGSIGAMYKGLDLFAIGAEDVVALISQAAPLDASQPEPGCLYTFPELEMALWRPYAPGDESDPEGHFFSVVGVGKR